MDWDIERKEDKRGNMVLKDGRRVYRLGRGRSRVTRVVGKMCGN